VLKLVGRADEVVAAEVWQRERLGARANESANVSAASAQRNVFFMV
jgi:hypothetical protein